MSDYEEIGNVLEICGYFLKEECILKKLKSINIGYETVSGFDDSCGNWSDPKPIVKIEFYEW